MATKMEMSLDEIISTTKKPRGGGRGRGGARGGGRTTTRGGGRAMKTAGAGRSSGGGIRRGGAATGRFRQGRRNEADRPGKWQHDKFGDSSLGGARRTSGVGTGPAKITISNLHYGVSDADIIELFSELGNIRFASVFYDRSGRSLGKADVTFERRAEAAAAIQQYNNVPLDGRPMQITWTNAAPAATQSSPARTGGLNKIQGKRIARPSTGASRSPRGGTRGAGGRGRGRGGGGGKPKAPTAEELDAELDAYVSQNQK